MSHIRVFFIAFVAACAGAVSAINVADTPYPITAPDGSTFRHDYFFHEQANGWLKFHRVPTPWYKARLTCRLEGARLASPLDENLFSTLRWLLQVSGVDSVYTGVHAMSSGSDYFSVEGLHNTEMPIDWAENQPKNSADSCLIMLESGQEANVNCSSVQPFFCYKEKTDQISMNECGNYGIGYTKDETTGSCYKVHASPATWDQAHFVCAAEGGRLAIINSKEEAKILSEMAKTQQEFEFVFVGIFNWYQDDQVDISHWATLTDQSLADAGFSDWLPLESRNFRGEEYCGTIAWQDEEVGLNDYSCSWVTSFICEIEKPRIPLWW